MKKLIALLLLSLSANSYATATLDCIGKPYYLTVIYSLSEGAQSFSFLNDGSLLVRGNVKELVSFSLAWPEIEQSSKNVIVFSGTWGDGNKFSGNATANTGNLTVNGIKYEFYCSWVR